MLARPVVDKMTAQRYLQRAVNKILVVVGDDLDPSIPSLRYAANLAAVCDASAILL